MTKNIGALTLQVGFTSDEVGGLAFYGECVD